MVVRPNLILLLQICIAVFASSSALADIAIPSAAQLATQARVRRANISQTPISDATSVYVGNCQFYRLDKNSGKFLSKLRLDSTLSTTPIIVEGTIYLATESGTVYAIKNDKVVWKLQTGRALIGRPVVCGRALCYLTFDSSIMAINSQTGKQQWDLKLSDRAIAISPVDANNVIYMLDDSGIVYAVDALKGKKLWQTERRSSQVCSQYQRPVIQNGLLYVYDSTAGIVVIDAKTGKEVRVYSGFDNDAARDHYVGGFVMDEQAIYVVGQSYNEGNFVCAIDKSSGKLVWKYKTDENPGYLPAVTSTRLLVGTESGALLLFDKVDGKLVSKNSDKSSYGKVTLKIPVKDGICLVATPPNTRAIEVATAKQIWKKVGAHNGAEPLIDNEIVYRVTTNGIIEALDLKSGASKWQFKTQDALPNNLT